MEATQRWTFVYLCANVDPTKIRDTLNLKAGNVTSFVSDSRGTIAASSLHSASTTSYLKGRARGMTATPTFYSDPDASAKSVPSADLIKPVDSEKPDKLV